jgi:hypothetical protein
LFEGFFERQVANVVTPAVEVQQTIKAYALFASDERSHGCVFLQSTTGANPHQGEFSQLFFFHSGFKVDVGECV